MLRSLQHVQCNQRRVVPTGGQYLSTSGRRYRSGSVLFPSVGAPFRDPLALQVFHHTCSPVLFGASITSPRSVVGIIDGMFVGRFAFLQWPIEKKFLSIPSS